MRVSLNIHDLRYIRVPDGGNMDREPRSLPCLHTCTVWSMGKVRIFNELLRAPSPSPSLPSLCTPAGKLSRGKLSLILWFGLEHVNVVASNDCFYNVTANLPKSRYCI